MFQKIIVLSMAAFLVNTHPHRSLNMDPAVAKLINEIDEAHLTSKPMMKLVEPLGPVKAAAGESISLRCEVTSTPSAVIRWEKNGKVVQGDAELNLFEKVLNAGNPIVESGIVSSTFNIPCATQEDAGVYVCVAYNGHETIESTSEVQIDGKNGKCPSIHHAAPQITLLTESRFELNGNAATLVCRSDKKAKWSWEFDGEMITYDSGKYELLPTGDLLVKNIQWQDMGDYFCTATTKYGQATGETFLYPTKREE